MAIVDIVVPCYNYGSVLHRCVSSVLAQTVNDVRVLIIDDASSDDTETVARTLANSDARVTYRRHHYNVGHIATYNEGIAWSESMYFLLLSADDYLTPGALARASFVMDQSPDVVLTCGRAAIATAACPEPTIPPQFDTCRFRRVPGSQFIHRCAKNAHESPLWTPTAIVRGETQRRVGGYRESLTHAGDLEMWLRIALRGAVGELMAVQAVYRVHGSNMHLATNNRVLGNSRQHLAAFESVVRMHGPEVPQRQRFEREYRRSLAVDAIGRATRTLRDPQRNGHDEYMSFAKQLSPGARWSRAMMKYIVARTLPRWMLILLVRLRAYARLADQRKE